ncbi:hypothetical protein ABZT02_32375 [Streptomyces sp. NPDC005402]|uniref:hypothetical protein n=1 Tax=Streptomyces sp. NPDC005402 TaxID=3155338 RepID=UPI0033A738A9
MTDDVLFLSGQQVTRLPDADTAIASRRAGARARPGSVDPGNATARIVVSVTGHLTAPDSTHLAVPDPGSGAPARVRRIARARTPSTTPVYGDRLAHGCTVVSGGSFEPARREAGTDQGAPAEHAGPVADAIRAGLPSDLAGLGEVPTGRTAARAARGDIVHHDGVGPGIQDEVPAWARVRAAKAVCP